MRGGNSNGFLNLPAFYRDSTGRTFLHEPREIGQPLPMLRLEINDNYFLFILERAKLLSAMHVVSEDPKDNVPGLFEATCLLC